MNQLQLIKPELQKTEEFFKNYWGEEFMYSGLAILPQVLLDSRVELNLSHAELYFIEKVFTLSFRGFVFIKDRDISIYNARNITTIRKRLKEKGYLDFEVRDNEDRNRGVIYDFSGLKKAVAELVKNNEKLRNTIAYLESDSETPDLFSSLYKDLKKEIKKENKKNKENKEIKKDKAIEVKETKEETKKEKTESVSKEIIENIEFKSARLLADSDNENNSKNKSEEDIFIEQYNQLHIKVLGFDLLTNKSNIQKLKKYLIKDYKDRKRTVGMAFDIAERSFLKLSDKQKTSLKLQDLVRQALAGILNIETKTRKVPRGAFVMKTLLDKVKSGKDFKTEYEKFESVLNEDIYAINEENYKKNRLIEEKYKQKYQEKWGKDD
ncbi:hypothetical protein [Brachyspira sp.]|uniref:hypothetical protein n=1 Tax=Brachyspira sp. TaxID=1977261 RepID=UPI003D7DDF89